MEAYHNSAFLQPAQNLLGSITGSQHGHRAVAILNQSTDISQEFEPNHKLRIDKMYGLSTMRTLKSLLDHLIWRKSYFQTLIHNLPGRINTARSSKLPLSDLRLPQS